MLIKTTEQRSFEGDDKTSILDAAIRSGVFFNYSCKNGQCGICKCTLLSGDIREIHAPKALSADDIANNKILTCCSAPKEDVLIDAVDQVELHGIKIRTSPARISELTWINKNIIKVVLRLPPSFHLHFLEGQYVDVIAMGGIRRSYSIANSSTEKTITLIIKNVPNGQLSKFWFETAKLNDLVHIDGPKGSFFYKTSIAAQKTAVIFLATGTGIAPIKSIIDHLALNPQKVEGKCLYLFWGNRSESDFFWKPQYSSLDVQFHKVLSRQSPTLIDPPEYVQHRLLREQLSLTRAAVYACGSIDMISTSKDMLIERGLDRSFFFSDAFVSSGVDK